MDANKPGKVSPFLSLCRSTRKSSQTLPFQKTAPTASIPPWSILRWYSADPWSQSRQNSFPTELYLSCLPQYFSISLLVWWITVSKIHRLGCKSCSDKTQRAACIPVGQALSWRFTSKPGTKTSNPCSQCPEILVDHKCYMQYFIASYMLPALCWNIDSVPF